MAQRLKHLPAMRETWVQSLGGEDPPEKEMATHSSILAWRIPWTEELGGLQSTGCKESDMTERLHFHFVAQLVKNPPAMWGDLGSFPRLGRSPDEGKGFPLQYSGLENSIGCIVHGVAKSWTRLSDFHFHFHNIFTLSLQKKNTLVVTH